MNRLPNIFIVVSLLFNLLLAGIIIGHMGHYFMGSPMHRSLQEIAMTLPENKREHFQTTMQQAEQDTGELHQQLSDARKKAASLLKAEPFDKPAFLAQMQQIHDLHGKIMQRMVEAIAGLAEQSSPEERATLADILRHPPRPASDD